MQREFDRACGRGEPSTVGEPSAEFVESHINEDEGSNTSTVFAINDTGRDADMDPFEGMKFKTEDEAHHFYNEYAMRMGFNTCIKHSRRSRTDGSLIFVEYGCSKHGFKKVSENTKNPRPCIKTNCKAAMKVKRGDHGVWIIVHFNNMHNHEIAPVNTDMSMKSNLGTVNIGVGATNMALLMDNIDKGVGDGVFNVLSHFEKHQFDTLGHGDAQAVYEHFIQLQMSNPTFFYAMDLDHDARPRCIFWVDARCRTDYTRFGDIVTFDTTFLINKCGTSFAPFVGVNHHGQSVLLGCAVIREETKASFVWLFKTWLAAMYGQQPVALITDQDILIKEAVSEVFPGTRHHFCIWHILQKLPKKLSRLCQENSRFVFDFKECIYKSLEVEEFEEKWWKMIESYDLVEDEWLASLFEDRQQWAPIYLNDSFFAGMSTLQRGESINILFNTCVSKQITLKQFVDQFELSLQSTWLQEAQADYETTYDSPSLKTTSPFEAQLSGIYTRAIFNRFQVEITGIPGCFTINSQQEAETIIYTVRDSEAKMDYKVIWNPTITNISCQCRTWELHGYLCRHAMLVLLMSGVHTIPSHYILNRWTMDGKNRFHLNRGIHVHGDRPESRVLRFNDLCRRSAKIAEEGSVTEECYHFAINALDEAIKKVADRNCFGRSTNQNILQNNHYKTVGEVSQLYLVEDNNRVDDPDIGVTKGSPKRTKSAIEKRKRSTYTCSNCKMTGHNVSTCSETQRQEQQRVQDLFNYGEVRVQEGSQQMEQLDLRHSVLANQCGTQERLRSL